MDPADVASHPPAEITRSTRFSFWTMSVVFGVVFAGAGYVAGELADVKTWADKRFVAREVQDKQELVYAVQMKAVSDKLDDVIRRLERIEEAR